MVEFDFIENARKRELEQLLERKEHTDEVLLVLCSNAPITDNPYFQVFNLEDDETDIFTVIAGKHRCVRLTDDNVREALLLSTFIDIIPFQIAKLVDYPDADEAEIAASKLEGAKVMSYLRIAAEVDHLDFIKKNMSDDELAHNLAARQTKERQKKDGSINELLDFDSSALLVAEDDMIGEEDE
nr:MAG: hypothetical protein 3 [Guangxi cystovirus 17]